MLVGQHYKVTVSVHGQKLVGGHLDRTLLRRQFCTKPTHKTTNGCDEDLVKAKILH